MLGKFFKDKNGQVVIWQWPNIYLWIWLGLHGLAKIADDSETKNNIQFAGNAVLFYWALKEIFQGESYFRRLLGIVVGASTIMWFINTLRD